MSQGMDVESSHDIPMDIASPWASESNVSFSSAIKHSETRPAIRRRVSDGAARRRRNDHEPYYGAHSRALTLDNDAAGPTGSHPLESPASSRSVKDFVSSLLSAHDTRPHMKRVLSDAEAASASADGSLGADSNNGRMAGTNPQPREEQRVVIMHEVMSNDSPAGVALKYGVSLPDIRRWNQLWPSDSIHLRKVLYIPLDRVRHAKQFRIIFADADESAVESESLPQSGSAVIPADEKLTHEDAREHLTVVRVPVTQLSFFPPPSTPPSARRTEGLAESQTFSHRAHSPSGRPALPPSFLSSSTSLPASSSPGAPYTSLGFSFSDRVQNRSLGALWTSARATFVERLSLDSNSATTSTQSEDMDWAHELEDISSSPLGSERPDEETIHGSPERHIPSRRRRIGGKSSARPTALELDHLPDASSRFEGVVQKPDDCASPARGAASQHKTSRYDDPDPILTSPVRTAQLQPSLAMQLPPIRKKPKPSGG